MDQKFSQFIHQVIDRSQAIEEIVAIAILDKIERELSQWYGDLWLTV